MYARKVCQEAGIGLIEADASGSLPFDPSYSKPLFRPNKPFPGLVSRRWMETIFEYMPIHESFSFISGHGSDHIFMRPPTTLSISDYILSKGIKGSKKEFENIATFYRDPLFQIFKANVKSITKHLFGIKKEQMHKREKINNIPKWVLQEAIKNLSDDISHPIYDYLPNNILPGKYAQVDALYDGLASIHIEVMNRADPTYYPYLYQPVVEFALSFPTYELFGQGYDRYPLRKAVSERFNTNTVWRRDKSQTTGLFQLGVKKNLKSILKICLEGHFANQGLIEINGFKKTIELIANGDTKNMWHFLHIVSAEMFLSDWDEAV